MAIASYFHPKNMTLEQFNEVRRRLEASGNAEPPGRIHHSCFGADGDLMVYEIWESPEAFEAFGAVLMPIVGEIGLDVGSPDVMPIQHVEQIAYS